MWVVAGMTLVSQAGPSYCIPTDISRKTAQNVVIGMASNIDASKLKETPARFSSLSCNSSKTPKILSSESLSVGMKRGHQFVVAASPPTEDAVVATEPLTKEDLIRYLASGCKPKENWR
jgi:glutamate--cysteine ligase